MMYLNQFSKLEYHQLVIYHQSDLTSIKNSNMSLWCNDGYSLHAAVKTKINTTSTLQIIYTHQSAFAGTKALMRFMKLS